MSRRDRIIGDLAEQLENAAKRIALMSNTALSFRQLIQKFGAHLPYCPEASCSCGWSRVEAFMADDSNFGEVQQVRDIAVEESKKVIHAP